METRMDRITTRMMEHICDNLCKYPDQLNEEELEEKHCFGSLPRTRLCLKSSEAVERKNGISIAWEDSVGLISMEYAYLYPPGIPLIVPGEEVTWEVISYLEQYRKRGFSIEGLTEEGRIKVCSDE